MPKKVRRLAMRCVLSGKVPSLSHNIPATVCFSTMLTLVMLHCLLQLLEGRLTIVDNLGLSEPKTKLLHARLSGVRTPQ